MRSKWVPTLITMGFLLAILILVILSEGGDPLALARLGTIFSQGDPNGEEGYDGQFVYYIANDLNPQSVAEHLDVPAYRYQRILFPLLARIFSFGNPDLIPWMLGALGLIAQTLGTLALGTLLEKLGISSWYAIVYGLWVGFVLAVRLDLPEPLAYALVIAALLGAERDRHGISWILYGLALFAKEVVLLFVAAQLLIYLWRNQWRKTLGMASVTLIPYAIFQIWLWNIFGDIGIGSGGAMATSFELIPLMGLWRVGAYSRILLLGYLVVFVPFVIFPALWGLWEVGKKFLDKDINRINLALGLHASSILFLPFSTFREPGGLLRYTCGLVLAVILFAARYRHQRALRYVPLWLVLNVFLLKS